MSIGLNILLKTSDKYEVLDVFKDENITIKETVKDFKDIKKIFTALSRSFTIPASKKNNKILRHFYRNDIAEIDTRALIDAKITLNNADYKYGNVSVESTNFKDNEPYSYTLRFYGNLTELNKRIGEDELTELDFTAHNISNPNFLNEFKQASVTRKAVAFPLLSKNRRFVSHSGDYDYTETEGFTDVVNVSYSSTNRADGYYGVIEQDLVGAIWTGAVLDAIEDKYGVNFTGALKDADYIRELRMLLQKRGGDGFEGSPFVSKQLSGFSENTYNVFSTTSNSINTQLVYKKINFFTELRGRITFQATTTATNFKVHLKKNGETIATTDTTDEVVVSLNGYEANNSIYTFEIEASGVATVSLSVTVESLERSKASITVVESASISASESFTGSEGDDYLVRDNLPTMKVIDFLSDIFKRFNIVATVDKDLNIDTKHFDAYVNQGNTIDISPYVDISSHTIARPNFHSGLRFTTESVKTVGEYGFQKVNGRKYGELKYDLKTGDNSLDGGMYKVDLKSNIIPVDAPIDVEYGIIANFQSIILIDRKGEEIDLGPTFMYTKIQENRNIAYDTGFSVSQVDEYVHVPSEVYYEDEDGEYLERFTIGNYFSSEISVMVADSLNFDDCNLFSAFYKNTVSIAFGESSRRAKYDAYLPIRFLSTLSTADTIIIANKKHIIESYSTNFLTGKTSFVLIQVDEDTVNLFRSSSVSTVSNKSTSYINADTGLASEVSVNGGTAINVIGGSSGVYRVEE